MSKKEQNLETLNTELYKKVMGDKVEFIAKLKEVRDELLGKISSEYQELDGLRKQRREINRKIRIQKRAINQDEKERLKLNRELSKQMRLSNRLTEKYSNEQDEVISSSKFYPEKAKKMR